MPRMGSRVLRGALLCVAGCYVSTAPPPQQQSPSRQAYWPRPPPAIGPPPARPIAHTPYVLTPTAMSARVIRADAPDGLGPQYLGTPLDAKFIPMVGAGAGSMFPQAGSPVVMTINEVNYDQELIKSVEQLNANVHAWMVNADASTVQTKRYGSYRAVQLSAVYELRDNTPMIQPPPGAVYYPWRVYMGHSYWEVVEGDASTFNDSVGAEFLHWGAKVSDFAGKYRFRSHSGGRGLMPKNGSSIFARGSQDIQASYTPFGPEVPIVVEYRQIPNTQTSDGTIVWTTPRNILVRFTNLQVTAYGAAIYNYATWNMAFQCFVNGQPFGDAQRFEQNVSLGNYPLAFSQELSVNDNDTIECFTSGSYLRANSWQTLGRSTTGPIVAGRITGATSNVMEGQDAKTRYAVTWSASRLP